MRGSDRFRSIRREARETAETAGGLPPGVTEVGARGARALGLTEAAVESLIRRGIIHVIFRRGRRWIPHSQIERFWENLPSIIKRPSSGDLRGEIRMMMRDPSTKTRKR